ncbi:MAG: TetR family transcriptional regulator [Bacillales bacterium]|jgi:hypothetical protein|nr:TetR family transcriptional regulator [Bacillales bacterium]
MKWSVIVRITKEHDDRKKEILDTAERLFLVSGYEKCTVNDVINSVGIAKGTFYHYFKTKEEVLDSIVSRYREKVVSRAIGVLMVDDISSEEKLMRVFMAMQITNQIDTGKFSDIHKSGNALLHKKFLNQIIIAMAPILVKIVENGIEKGVWSCRFPLQYMQILLASSLTLTDEGIFGLDADSQLKVMGALISLLEKMLNVTEGSLVKIYLKGQEQ